MKMVKNEDCMYLMTSKLKHVKAVSILIIESPVSPLQI